MATKPIDPDAMMSQAEHAGALVRARKGVESANRRLDREIREAVGAGLSLRQVAHATKLSHSQVSNIVRRADGASE